MVVNGDNVTGFNQKNNFLKKNINQKIMSIIKSKTVKAKDLKIDPLLKKLGMETDEQALAFYADESNYFGHYDTLCVTTGNTVISHPEVWLAAMKNNPEMLLTVDEIDIDDDDLIRFVSGKSIFIRKNYQARYVMISELRNYIENNPKGHEWNQKLAVGDINETIGHIMNYKESSIKQMQAVGEYVDANPTEISWEDIGHLEYQIGLKTVYTRALAAKPKSEEKIKAQAEKIARQQQQSMKLKGNEALNFQLNWIQEGKVVRGRAINVKSSNPSKKIYKYKLENETLITVVVDIPKTFARVANNPIDFDEQKQRAQEEQDRQKDTADSTAIKASPTSARLLANLNAKMKGDVDAVLAELNKQ